MTVKSLQVEKLLKIIKMVFRRSILQGESARSKICCPAKTWHVCLSLSHSYRYTILETGPMETQAHVTAQDWGKTIVRETVDKETKKLEKENYQHLSSKKMDCYEIAAIVREIILGQNNNFRCYTHTPTSCLMFLPPS